MKKNSILILEKIMNTKLLIIFLVLIAASLVFIGVLSIYYEFKVQKHDVIIKTLSNFNNVFWNKNVYITF